MRPDPPVWGDAVTWDELRDCLIRRREALNLPRSAVERRIFRRTSIPNAGNVARYERGERQPSVETLFDWAAAVGVEIGIRDKAGTDV